MNWLLLIIAGLLEVGFTTCLGKAREAGSNTFYGWLVFLYAWSSVCSYYIKLPRHCLLVLPMLCGQELVQ